jgi:hypothetical protein
MISPMRAQVIAALEAAGFRSSEHHLPVYPGGGCFSAIGGDSTGVNVTALRWDATQAELAEMLAAVATALRAAGFRVDDLGTRLYIPPEA